MQKGYELTMDDRNRTGVTKQETLSALRKPGELYVIMSAATRMPFVVCDDETYDDEVLLYYRLDDAKEKAGHLADEKYKTAVAKIEEKQLLAFYTSLYAMGVNCLSVNSGTDMQTSIQLEELVVRKKPEQLPEGKKLVENPSLHLTALYFMQELRRLGSPQLTEELRDMQEELLAHYKKGTYILAAKEEGQIPVLKQKDGAVYQPLFTDLLEFQKFARGQKMKTLVIPAAKIPDILAKEAKGIVINPLGVNLQLQVTRQEQKPAS